MSLFHAQTDFKDRDKAIAVNSYTTVKRRQGVPPEVFAAYWRDVHGPLCSRLPGLGWYVQHHFAREQDSHLWQFAKGIGPIPNYFLDGMVEIGFASAADQKTFKKASPILFADEQNIFEETIAYALPDGSTTYVDRLAEGTPNGSDTVDRLHLHFHAKPGMEAQFAEYLKNDFAIGFSKAEAVLRLRLHLPNAYSNAEPNPPSPDVEHAVETQRKTLGIVEIAFENALERRRFLTLPDVIRTLQTQARVTGAASAFAVSGVYTYVRESRLTTAGLRGSRAAELITALGALNQVSKEVESLLFTGRM